MSTNAFKLEWGTHRGKNGTQKNRKPMYFKTAKQAHVKIKEVQELFMPEGITIWFAALVNRRTDKKELLQESPLE